MLKTIALIPARYDSTRFPGKLMEDLGGKTVIRRTYEATLATGLFNAVYVVTDSEIIYRDILDNGGKAIFSATRHESGSDRIAEAAANLDADIVVNVQGDEPFTSRVLLENLLKVFEEEGSGDIDLATPMVTLKDWEDIENPNNVKVIADKNANALYFSRSVIPYPRDTKAGTVYYKHIGIYAFRKQALLDFTKLEMRHLEKAEKIECLRYLEYGRKIKMVETNELSIGIDTPEDLEKARKRLNSL